MTKVQNPSQKIQNSLDLNPILQGLMIKTELRNHVKALKIETFKQTKTNCVKVSILKSCESFENRNLYTICLGLFDPKLL
jgi:hypothetical protein